VAPDLALKRVIVYFPRGAQIWKHFLELLGRMAERFRCRIYAYVLLDDHFKKLSMQERMRLGETLKRKEEADRSWINGLIAEHLKRTRFFWQLYPGLLTIRWRRLKNLSPSKRIICFPAAAGSVLVAFVASLMAWKALKEGGTGYWPKKDGKSSNSPRRSAPEATVSATITERTVTT